MKHLKLLVAILMLCTFLYASEEVPTQEEVAKLYVATFNRAPDSAGLSYWVNSSGLKLSQIAQSFFDQPETQTLYPTDTLNRDFINSVYQNLFNRAPDTAGWDYWENELNIGSFSKNRFIEAVINGALNDDATVLTNKTAVGLAFANAGMDDINNAINIMLNITYNWDTVTVALSLYGIEMPTQEGVWTSFGNGLESPVNSLAFYNGNLHAASYGVAFWNGLTWTDMSDGMLALFGAGDVYALADLNNDFFAAGTFTVLTPDGNWYNNAGRFYNGSWTTCGTGLGDDGSGMSDPVYSMIEYNGQLYAGGVFGFAGGDPLQTQYAGRVAVFYGGLWHPVGGGMDDTVTDMVVYNGELIVSGYFTKAEWLDLRGDDYNPNPVIANYIAKWNGTNWSALGSGMDNKVTALAVHNGELYAGGQFETAGGISAKNIAKWDGQSWSSVGNGITHQVYTLASYNNKLYAGGAFTILAGSVGDYIIRWDGSQWESVNSGTNGPVLTLYPDSSGLIIGGSFSSAGDVSANNIAKYSIP